MTAVNEKIKHLAVILRVDTDRRRLECVIDVPDGAPHLETGFLVRQALGAFPGAGWREVSRVVDADERKSCGFCQGCPECSPDDYPDEAA
jgi:hypothetical protein